ncbi:TVP38/TMEM64 family protein [Verrucomicrobiota bacterium sgz303538]
MRLFWIGLGLAILFLIPFLIWGEHFEQWFTGDAAIQWVRSWGAWGWLAVITLLCADLVLPLPATGVMSAAGFLYGTLVGGAISALGSFFSGMLAYGLCRAFGRGIAEKLAGKDDLARSDTLFRRRGAWIVALSRWLPLLPEVIACLAGLTRMPLRPFTIALACGSVPLGFVYSAIGAAGQSHPGLALGLSVVVPAILYAAVQPLIRSVGQTCSLSGVDAENR